MDAVRGELPPQWEKSSVVVNALDVVAGYSTKTGCESLRVAVDSLRLMGDFLADAAPQAAASLALAGLAFRTGRTTAAPARRSLKEFSRKVGVDSGEWAFCSGILADMLFVSEQATSSQTLVTPDSRLSAILNRRLYGQSVPPSIWSQLIGFAPPKLMGETIQTVNSEAFPLLALYDVALMRQNVGLSERNFYRIAYGTEALIAPVVETQRYVALAGFNRSLERVGRLERLGGAAAGCVEHAAEIEKKYQTRDEKTVLRVMNGAIRAFFGDEAYSRFVIPDESGHGMRFAEFVTTLPNFQIRGLLRTKPHGNIALKLFEDGYEPVDIYGMTFVVQNAEQISELFAHIVEKVRQSSGMELIASESRPGKAFKIQGDDPYIETILSNPHLRDALSGDPSLMIDIKPVSNGDFRVAKLTFGLRTRLGGRQVRLPFEIQIQTEADRQESQIGATSHAVREAEKRGLQVDIDPLTLRTIYERADPRTMGTVLWPASLKRGANYRNYVSLAKG